MNSSRTLFLTFSFSTVGLLASAVPAVAQSPAPREGLAPEIRQALQQAEAREIADLLDSVFRTPSRPRPQTPQRPHFVCSLPKAATSATPTPWPGGVVPFEFDANVTPDNRRAMLEAMDEWQSGSPLVADPQIAFVRRTPGADPNYVHIQDASVNNSYVGTIGGSQDINIFDWGWKYVMAHELSHALGFWHEQSRTDRKSFVQINTQNIAPGEEHNFSQQVWIPGTEDSPYDFNSVMHYSQCTFSACGGFVCENVNPEDCRTITVLPPNEQYQDQIGQLSFLSTTDRQDMNVLYGTKTAFLRYVDWEWAEPTPGTHDGSLRYPFDEITDLDSEETELRVYIRGGTYAAEVMDRPGVYRAMVSSVIIDNP